LLTKQEVLWHFRSTTACTIQGSQQLPWNQRSLFPRPLPSSQNFRLAKKTSRQSIRTCNLPAPRQEASLHTHPRHPQQRPARRQEAHHPISLLLQKHPRRRNEVLHQTQIPNLLANGYKHRCQQKTISGWFVKQKS